MKRLLLAAAGVAIFSGPALSQPQPDQGKDHRAVVTAHPTVATPQRGPGARTPDSHIYGGPTPGGQHFTPGTPGQAGPARRYTPGYVTPGAPQTGARQLYPGSDHHMVNGQDRWRRPGGGDQWRNRGQRGEGWWRGQRGFERYAGRRDGFWFAPGFGYYRPDPRWYGYDWEVGASVPYELRNYYITDPYAYSLPPAPYGCAWIYLGNELVMIDTQTGQIVQMGGDY